MSIVIYHRSSNLNAARANDFALFFKLIGKVEITRVTIFHRLRAQN